MENVFVQKSNRESLQSDKNNTSADIKSARQTEKYAQNNHGGKSQNRTKRSPLLWTSNCLNVFFQYKCIKGIGYDIVILK